MEVCQRCGGSKYTDALKKFNAGKPAWCFPRKGTDLHAEVLSLIEKPKTRKLRKASPESVTNLGKEGQKRIEEFTDTKPNISRKMEVKKTRKLRKAPVKAQTKVLKPGECQYCGKVYKNLKQHITKAHLHFYIEIDRSGEEPTITVTDQDGKVLVKDEPPQSEGDDKGKIIWNFYFESKSGEGNLVILTEDGEVTVNRDVYNETTGRISSVTKAFKNWSVKFV
jgi:uncharacterized FlaG/YvyC family protein